MRDQEAALDRKARFTLLTPPHPELCLQCYRNTQMPLPSILNSLTHWLCGLRQMTSPL